jgi:hypothetical protein
MEIARPVLPMVNVTFTDKNMIHPLDKIFGDIPAGSRDVPTLE